MIFFLHGTEYKKVVVELENLEKVVLRDSVRETLKKKRVMESICEEQDLAFNNLSYGLMSNLQERYYENVEDNRTYENVGQSDKSAFYENSKFKVNNCSKDNQTSDPTEEYETYDFGESGVYQNLVFNKGSPARKVDSSNDISTLKKSVNSLNEQIRTDKQYSATQTIPPKKLFCSKLEVTLKQPNQTAPPTRQATCFTLQEKEIVAKFLKNFKSELSS